jgi:hypothetical protein
MNLHSIATMQLDAEQTNSSSFVTRNYVHWKQASKARPNHSIKRTCLRQAAYVKR